MVTLGVRPLVNTPVTPNQLTTLRLLAGIGAATLYALGEPHWVHWGGAVFVLGMLLDRADGILARLTGKTSAWGHTYDLVADGLCNALVFVGIGVGLRASELGAWAVPLGLVAGTAVTAVLWLVMRAEQRRGPRAAELGDAAGFDPDDAMLAVPVAMSLGWSVGLLWAAALGATLFAALFYWRFRGDL